MSKSLPLPSGRKYPKANYYEFIDELADKITQLSGHLNAGNYQLLKLIGEFDHNEGWTGEGVRSCAHWLNLQCGTNIGAAREKVRVARALPNLPEISSAFREGRVSYSKVRAMTRVATPKNEDELLNVALYGTASHVETQVRLYRMVKRLDALDDENLRHGRRELSWYTDDDGSVVLKGRFTPEQGAVITKALDAAMDQLFEEQKQVPEDVSAETSHNQLQNPQGADPIASRRADALERVAEGFLASTKTEGSSGDRYLVNIHTEMDVLQQDGDAAESELEDGANVSAETSRRLACDCARVDWVENEEGNPLNIGRKSRSIPPAIRRALKRRDRGCRFPGCTCNRFVDAHHVVHWADGGETSMQNLVLLCRSHHRLVHEGGYGVDINAEQHIHFTMPNGRTLSPGSNTRFRGNVFAIETANRENGVDITPDTAISGWDGERAELSRAVELLLRLD